MTQTKVKSPLRYPGGKTRAVTQILSLIPSTIDVVCSPFLGGGSIEIALSQRGVKIYAYDAFQPLINFWTHLLHHREQLFNAIQKYHPITKERFYELRNNYHNIQDKVDMAAVFFVINRASFSGTTFSGGMSPNHPRFTQSSIDAISTFILESFFVDCLDFKDSLILHESDFLYLDPPYFTDQQLYGLCGNLHKNFDHQGLFDILKHRDKWILSYNDCDFIRDLYSGYRFLTPTWSYGMTSNKLSKEVIILDNNTTCLLFQQNII